MKGKWIFLQQIWGVLWGRLIYICERGKDLRGSTHERYGRILKIFGRKSTMELEKRAIATKAAQVCFSLLLEFLPMFDFSSCSFPNTQCIVDWCGRKGPQFVLLRFVACLFALFWFWVYRCLGKYMTPCLSLIMFVFFGLNPILLYSHYYQPMD